MVCTSLTLPSGSPADRQIKKEIQLKLNVISKTLLNENFICL